MNYEKKCRYERLIGDMAEEESYIRTAEYFQDIKIDILENLTEPEDLYSDEYMSEHLEMLVQEGIDAKNHGYRSKDVEPEHYIGVTEKEYWQAVNELREENK